MTTVKKICAGNVTLHPADAPQPFNDFVCRPRLSLTNADKIFAEEIFHGDKKNLRGVDGCDARDFGGNGG